MSSGDDVLGYLLRFLLLLSGHFRKNRPRMTQKEPNFSGQRDRDSPGCPNPHSSKNVLQLGVAHKCNRRITRQQLLGIEPDESPRASDKFDQQVRNEFEYVVDMAECGGFHRYPGRLSCLLNKPVHSSVVDFLARLAQRVPDSGAGSRCSAAVRRLRADRSSAADKWAPRPRENLRYHGPKSCGAGVLFGLLEETVVASARSRMREKWVCNSPEPQPRNHSPFSELAAATTSCVAGISQDLQCCVASLTMPT